VSAASPTRLVTRNAISLIFRLPLAYLPKIQALPGITGLAYGQWFGGIYPRLCGRLGRRGQKKVFYASLSGPNSRWSAFGEPNPHITV